MKWGSEGDIRKHKFKINLVEDKATKELENK